MLISSVFVTVFSILMDSCWSDIAMTLSLSMQQEGAVDFAPDMEQRSLSLLYLMMLCFLFDCTR